MEHRTIEACALAALEVSIPTPGRKAKKEDLKKAADNLPPEAIATMGVFRIFDPKTVAPLYAIKREAERMIEKIGVRFGRMGRVIARDPEKIQILTNDLEALQTKFYGLRTHIMNDFQNQQDAWIRQFPEWESVLRKKAGALVDLRMEFRFHLLEIQPAGPGGNTEELVQGLSGQLTWEIHQEALSILENSFLGRETVTQKAINPIRTMRDKVDGLTFVSPRAYILLEIIDHMLEKTPQTGRLLPRETDAVRATLHLLGDHAMLNDHIERIFQHRKAGHAPQHPDDVDAAAGLLPLVLDDETETGEPVVTDGNPEPMTTEETPVVPKTPMPPKATETRKPMAIF